MSTSRARRVGVGHDLYAEVGFVSFPDPGKLMVLGPVDQ